MKLRRRMTYWNSSCLKIDLYLHTHTNDKVLPRLMHLVRTECASPCQSRRSWRSARPKAAHYSSLYNNLVKWGNCEKPLKLRHWRITAVARQIKGCSPRRIEFTSRRGEREERKRWFHHQLPFTLHSALSYLLFCWNYTA